MIHRIKCQMCGNQNAPACEPDDGVCAGCWLDEYTLAKKRTDLYNDEEIGFIKELLNKLCLWARHNGVEL